MSYEESLRPKIGERITTVMNRIFALGLIASRAAARQALERLNGAGLLQGDPRLDMLRLNAALDDNGAKP